MADFDTFKKYFGRKNNKTGYLATIAGRGRPTLRPVSFFLIGKKVYFCACSGDVKVKQIKRTANVGVCIPVNRGRWRGYYRIAAEAVLVTDAAARKRLFRKIPYPTEDFWEGPDDPRFAAVEVKSVASRYLPPAKYQEVDVKL